MSSTGQPSSLNPAIRQENPPTRSVSQGRGQKLLSNQRAGDGQKGAAAGKPMARGGNNRVQAISEAYNQNPSYLINNQMLQQQAMPVPQLQPAHQHLQSWRGQQAKLNSKGGQAKLKNVSLNKGRQTTSHENIQYRTDDHRQHQNGTNANSMKGPQYNNLVAESQKYLASLPGDLQYNQVHTQNSR